MTATTDQSTETRADVCAPSSLEFAALPGIGADLAGGLFAGITTTAEGSHCAVVRLPGQADEVTHLEATEWAAAQGGVLPSRPVAALLYMHLKGGLKPDWHWTSEAAEFDASCAWGCHFDYGSQYYYRKGAKACAVAVRLIPLTA